MPKKVNRKEAKKNRKDAKIPDPSQTGSKSKETKLSKVKKGAPRPKPLSEGKEQLLSSEVIYEGRLFRVLKDRLIEPSGLESERELVRHNGSVVILALDATRSKKDPWLVIERQYRHAASQYLWELPAGKLDSGEDPLAGAQRELAEETGYSAKKWRQLVEYYASPGFLGESMRIFVAEGLTAGVARPEEDERIEFRLVRLSDALKMIEKGAILDGKTLTGLLLYARLLSRNRKK
jgi:ADP-ribose pyrophosphatase